MNRRYYITALLLTVAIALFAQTTEEQKKKINSVKKSSAYLYAEITTNNQQTALDLAEDMLNQEINKYVAEQKKLRNAPNIVLKNRQQFMESITLPRGNMFRAFKYVKKSDIIPADNVEVRSNTPVVDEEGKTTTVTTTVATTEVPATVPAASEKRTKAINQLLGIRKFSEINSTLPKMKMEGMVSETAKLKEVSDRSQWILLIYNREGNVEAVLSEGPNRINLRTNLPDSEKNYPGRGAICVKVNN